MKIFEANLTTHYEDWYVDVYDIEFSGNNELDYMNDLAYKLKKNLRESVEALKYYINTELDGDDSDEWGKGVFLRVHDLNVEIAFSFYGDSLSTISAEIYNQDRYGNGKRLLDILKDDIKTLHVDEK